MWRSSRWESPLNDENVLDRQIHLGQGVVLRRALRVLDFGPSAGIPWGAVRLDLPEGATETIRLAPTGERDGSSAAGLTRAGE